ncbi:HamA C-terminal domain-containing protein [Leptospira haakeii]|uniref:Anti-bacteriophage protein A/HamA C-terminal domain-containing protein n=1 Tax=Leptospira haakeii TaxID=2023198 RepID=A0ABX4PKW2_9LEPT|nr:DUF1837 domain-containing protein [Leptospira haakeii]PKA16422.1 hypothetical protein CH363_08345 [Leptospira haakeii]PKA18509.1 hypothetical protein CH377_17230 [Leptospira haakeii]
MRRPFKSELVIDELINETGLKAFNVGYDQKQFRLKELVDIIRAVIPEFAFGYHEGVGVPMQDIVDRIQEAATAVYTTDKYQRRGEFGELILHLLLREFCGTTPLISKIYFKDSNNTVVHGFDAIQASEEAGKKRLWLGESKLYKNGKDGIDELLNDVKYHLKADYIRSEFSLLAKKLPQDVKDINDWRQLLDKKQRLDVVFSTIVLALVCTYSSPTIVSHNDNTPQYITELKRELKDLHKEFCSKVNAGNFELILMLLPVPDKDALNQELDTRLKRMQGI